MNHRNPRVMRRSDGMFEVVVPGGDRFYGVLTDIEAHRLYVQLAIALGFTTEAVEGLDE